MGWGGVPHPFFPFSIRWQRWHPELRFSKPSPGARTAHQGVNEKAVHDHRSRIPDHSHNNSKTWREPASKRCGFTCPSSSRCPSKTMERKLPSGTVSSLPKNLKMRPSGWLVSSSMKELIRIWKGVPSEGISSGKVKPGILL
jgi:hypothetical protein